MNELATHFVRLLGQTTLALSVAVLATALILRGLRVTSPTAHRVGWTLALLTGWWFVRLSAQVPWYEPAADVAAVNVLPSQLGPIADAQAPSDFSLADLADLQGPIELASPIVDGDTLLADSAVIEIGPGSDASSAPGPDFEPSFAEDPLLAPAPSALTAAELETPIFAAAHKPRIIAETAPEPAPPSVWPLVAICVWALGVCLAIAVWLVGYVRFVRRLPVARPAVEAWTEQWRALQTSHRVRRPIPLRVTENLGPMLCRLPRGYALLVPEALWRDLDAPQRAAVLRHELAHYLRRDVWKSLAVRALALPHWFNPLAWWAVRQFDEGAEWACDRAAAADEPATAYARTLVRLGESVARHAAYSPAARAASLSGRVRRLLSARTDRDSAVKKLLLASIAVVVVATLAVRVELVAKERDDEATNSAATQTDGEKAKEEAPAATVDNANPDSEPRDANAPDSAAPPEGNEPQNDLSEAETAMIEAGERGFLCARAAYDTDTITLDEVCAWSLRWLAAVELSAKSPAEKVAANQANLDRHEALRAKVKALFEIGARGGEAEKMAMTDFYVADANRRLAHAKRAEQAQQKADKQAVEVEVARMKRNWVTEKASLAQQQVTSAKAKLGEAMIAKQAADQSGDPAQIAAAEKEVAKAQARLAEAIQEAERSNASLQNLRTARDKAIAQDEKVILSHARVIEVREAEARVKAAEGYYEAAKKNWVASDAVRDPEKYEAARLKAAEAERAMDQAIRKAIAARSAFGSLESSSQTPSTSAENVQEQKPIAEQVSEIILIEERVLTAKKELRQALRAQTGADRTGAAEKIAAAEQAVVDAQKAVKAAEEKEVHLRGAAEPSQLSNEANSRANVERWEEQIDAAQAQVDDALMAQRAAFESGNTKTIAALDKIVGKANQSLAEAKRGEKAAREGFYKLLKRGIENSAATPRADLPLEIKDRIYNDAVVQKLEKEIADFDAALEKYVKGVKQDQKSHAQAQMQKQRAGLQAKLAERIKELEQRYAPAGDRWRSPAVGAAASQPVKFLTGAQVNDVVVDIEAGGRYTVNGDPQTEDELKTLLQQAEADHPGGVNVVIHANREAPWQSLANVMNLCKELKISSYSATVAQQKPDEQKFNEQKPDERKELQPDSAPAKETANGATGQSRASTTNDPQLAQIRLAILQQQLTIANSNLLHSIQRLERLSVEVEQARNEKAAAEDPAAILPSVQDKILNDQKVRKLKEEIAEHDAALVKLKQSNKPDESNPKAEQLAKERAGLQEKLNDLTKQLKDQFNEPVRAQRLQEAESTISVASKSIEQLNKRIAEYKKQIQETTAELRNYGFGIATEEDQQARLRYNGRSFAEWREELETELSTERLAEACEAFAAFAKRGYGAEAASQIVAVGAENWREPDSTNTPAGKLANVTRYRLLGLPVEFVLPSLIKELKSPQLNHRQFAAIALSERGAEATAAAADLLRAAQDADSTVSQLAINALSKMDTKESSLISAVRAALADSDVKVQVAAIRVAGGLTAPTGLKNPDPMSQFAPELIEKLKDPNSTVALAALQALGHFGAKGEAALPIVLPWLKQDGTQRQTLSLKLIEGLGPAAASATPALIELADSGDAGEKMAIRCLGEIGSAAKEAVPRLMAIANSRSNTGAAAVRALGRMGPAAAEAIPLLEKFASGKDWPHLREDAKAALPLLRGERSLKPDSNQSPKPTDLKPLRPATPPGPGPTP